MSATAALKRPACARLLATLLALASFGQPLAAQIEAPHASAKIITVSSFGAVGDGTTDDTAALQRALDSLHAGDTLVVPAGVVVNRNGKDRNSKPQIR